MSEAWWARMPPDAVGQSGDAWILTGSPDRVVVAYLFRIRVLWFSMMILHPLRTGDTMRFGVFMLHPMMEVPEPSATRWPVMNQPIVAADLKFDDAVAAQNLMLILLESLLDGDIKPASRKSWQDALARICHQCLAQAQRVR